LADPVVVLKAPLNDISICQEVSIEVASVTQDKGKGILNYEWILTSM
jgi:hypothetical protein